MLSTAEEYDRRSVVLMSQGWVASRAMMMPPHVVGWA